MSSSSSLLPPVGTRFASLLEVKLAAFEAAEQGPYPLRVFSAQKKTSIVVACVGLGNKNSMIRDNATPCTCRVRAAHVQGGGYEVRSVENRHTCPLPSPGSEEARKVREDMGARVLEVKRELERETSEDERGEETDSSEGSASYSSSSSSSSTSSRSSRSANSTPPSCRDITPSTSHQSPRKRSASALSLRKKDLRGEINALAQGPRLSFPNSQHLFLSARPLLLHLYAWATQRGFPLNHVPSSALRIVVHCKPDSQAPRCPWEVVIHENDEGKWYVLSRFDTHDEDMHDKAVATGRGKPLPASQSVGADCPSPASSARPSSSVPSRLLPTAPALKPPKRPRTSAYSSPTLQPSLAADLPPPTAPAASSANDLTFFLSAFPPFTNSNELAFLGSALSESNASSLNDIATLLHFDEATLHLFVGEVGRSRGWPEEATQRAMQLLEEVRRSYAAEVNAAGTG